MNSSKTVWNKINHNLDHSSLIFSFPGGANGEEPICQCRRLKRHGFNPWIRKIPAGRHNNQPQYSSLWNLVDRGAWRATVHSITELDMHAHNANIKIMFFSSVQSLSHVQLFATPWTAALQASLSITN